MGKHSDRSLIGSLTLVDPAVEEIADRFRAEVDGLVSPIRYRALVALRRQGLDHREAVELLDQAVLEAVEEGFDRI
jgi:hypothetical protein